MFVQENRLRKAQRAKSTFHYSERKRKATSAKNTLVRCLYRKLRHDKEVIIK